MTATVTPTAPPLTVAQVAEMLNVSPASVRRLAGLVWLEYQGAGKRKIRRVTSNHYWRQKNAAELRLAR